MKRVHGRLLIYTGILHIIVTVLPGVFGTQIIRFAKKGFFNISKGLLEFDLLGGVMNYDNFAAFWFLYMGLTLILIGFLFDYIESKEKGIPLNLIIYLTILSFIGAFMIPISGMTLLLLPQCIYMFIRCRNF